VDTEKIIEVISQKGADREAIAAEVLNNPKAIPTLIKGLAAKKANLRYGSEKVLRLVSEKRPELIYPHFGRFVELLGVDNKFLKWGAILTIANLAAVDDEQRIEQIFDRYFAPLTGPVMVTAANIIGGSTRIIRAKPDLADRIAAEILKVEKAKYLMHGEISPECSSVVCGHAVDFFIENYDRFSDKKRVRAFVQRQLQNSRPAVRRKAKAFFDAHKESADG
jgi:hypothetical protein